MKKKRWGNSEFRKSVLIIVLLLISVYQMGILWIEKNPGVPISFLSQMVFWRNNDTVKIGEVKENYYRPKTILVSEGRGDLYWQLDSKNNFYRSIWSDLKNSYFKQIMEIRPAMGEKAYERDWYSLVKMKSIIIEFENPIPLSIISWMEGIDVETAPTIKDIYKIAVFPTEDINHNKNTLYVYDGQSVHKYVVTIEQGNMKKEDYVKAIENISSNENVIAMNRLISYFPSVENKELLVSLLEEKEKKIWDLLVKTPDEIILRRDNIERIKEYILSQYKGSVVTKLGENETNVIFSDSEQVFRFYQNGFLDYQYRNKSLGEKGLVEEALEKALMFIEYRRKALIDGAGVYLSKYEETENNYYIFTFDYVVDDMKIKIIEERSGTIKPAIVIHANRDRVLEAKWYIKSFTYNDYANQYNLCFIDFFDFFESKLVQEYPQLTGMPVIRDISNDYLLSENGIRAEPYWLVETESGIISLRMQGREE